MNRPDSSWAAHSHLTLTAASGHSAAMPAAQRVHAIGPLPALRSTTPAMCGAVRDPTVNATAAGGDRGPAVQVGSQRDGEQRRRRGDEHQAHPGNERHGGAGPDGAR